jgi:hypothetical protein
MTTCLTTVRKKKQEENTAKNAFDADQSEDKRKAMNKAQKKYTDYYEKEFLKKDSKNIFTLFNSSLFE